MRVRERNCHPLSSVLLHPVVFERTSHFNTKITVKRMQILPILFIQLGKLMWFAVVINLKITVFCLPESLSPCISIIGIVQNPATVII